MTPFTFPPAAGPGEAQDEQCPGFNTVLIKTLVKPQTEKQKQLKIPAKGQLRFMLGLLFTEKTLPGG